eukprot:GAHX01000284.1.p2 GENE.GAHX01000284.1~~GAHX01000284.1.p2  ORF type:complete len:302 (-),score=47.33 GAHX01000284.1:1763-2632(-)
MDFSDNFSALKSSLLNQNQMINSINIENFYTIDDTTYYEIKLSNSSFTWNVWHRFSEFSDLHKTLKDSVNLVSGRDLVLPAFPAKQSKILFDHLEYSFIKRRQIQLNQYLNQLRKIVIVNASTTFRNFSLSQHNNSMELRRYVNRRVLEQNKNTLKDVTDVTIDSWTLSNDHVIYHIRFSNSNKEGPYSSWLCLKRYEEFDKFNKDLKSYINTLPSSLNPDSLTPEMLPQLPEKKIKFITDHRDHKFLEERRMGLEEYLRAVIESSVLSTSSIFLKFAGVISEQERVVL